MKRKKIGLLAITLGVVGIGSLSLIFSMEQIKNSVENKVELDTQITSYIEKETTVRNKLEEELMAHMQISQEEEERIQMVQEQQIEAELVLHMQEESICYWNEALAEQEKEKQSWDLLQESEEDFIYTPEVMYMYNGQKVKVHDTLVYKEEAEENSRKIMDFVWDYVDETILIPYGIDKTEYEYSITRQYDYPEIIKYAVCLEKVGYVQCTMGVILAKEPILLDFTMDGMVSLCSGSEIPEAYRVENWCQTLEEKEEIYQKNYEISKNLIENQIGLSPILETKKNVENRAYFSAAASNSYMYIGYVLEDGTYVRVFYNRVNGELIGFAIMGYHEELFEFPQ